MQNSNSCLDCYFSSRPGHPGPQPEAIIQNFLGVFPVRVMPPAHIMESFYLRKYLYDNTLTCRRYPHPEIVYKNYGCGEFQDRFDMNKGVLNEEQAISK